MPDLSKATLINSTILNGAGSESTDTDVAGLEQSDTGPTGREPNIQTERYRYRGPKGPHNSFVMKEGFPYAKAASRLTT